MASISFTGSAVESAAFSDAVKLITIDGGPVDGADVMVTDCPAPEFEPFSVSNSRSSFAPPPPGGDGSSQVPVLTTASPREVAQIAMYAVSDGN